MFKIKSIQKKVKYHHFMRVKILSVNLLIVCLLCKDLINKILAFPIDNFFMDQTKHFKNKNKKLYKIWQIWWKESKLMIMENTRKIMETKSDGSFLVIL